MGVEDMQDSKAGSGVVRDPDGNEYNEGDVFFECPRCEKSMAISKAGIGMVINCTECGLDLIVPSSGGSVKLADDYSTEQGEDTEVGNNHDQNYHLSREQRDHLFDEIASIQGALDRLVSMLDSL